VVIDTAPCLCAPVAGWFCWGACRRWRAWEASADLSIFRPGARSQESEYLTDYIETTISVVILAPGSCILTVISAGADEEEVFVIVLQ